MMYRVILFIVVLAYCSSFPFSGSNEQTSFINTADDEFDIVDNAGAGYSYYSKQDIETRPSVDIPSQDFSTDIQTNTFQQQPFMTRSNLQVQTLSPKPMSVQQPVFLQNDFSQTRAPVSNGFNTQQASFLMPSTRFIQNTFSNQQQQQRQNDLRTTSSQQMFLPTSNLNSPQQTFTDFDDEQQTLSVPQQSQQTWSAQQQSTGFSSFFDGQDQQPITSSFVIQSNQQNDMEPVTNAVFMSSQVPTRRIIAQSQPTQQVFNNDW